MMKVIVGKPESKSPGQKSGLPGAGDPSPPERAEAPSVRAGTFGKEILTEELKWEEMSAEELTTLASTEALFGGARSFLLVGAINSARQEEFLDLAEVFARSPHTFVCEEEKLLKAPTTQLQKAGANIEVFAKEAQKEKFNVFALANVFAVRDRRRLWLALLEAARAGVAPEALAGMLHWKVRVMLSDARPGRYSRAELVALSRQLVALYHDSHRGQGDLALLLERFALKL